VLAAIPRVTNENVLVGFDTADDAGVYQISPDNALVQTVDFFTPVVDDPYIFGQIAAVNALSDVYAMGGRPLSALAMVCFPEKGELEILERILAGGLSKMMEAKCTVIGGHSIRDAEIKFGYAVTGTIHPEKIWRNVGARTGDALLFTKPLGTGVISTALKNDKAPADAVSAAIHSMSTLNRAAAEALHEIESETKFDNPIHAVTDVTGFGLLGHAREMALGNPAKGIETASFEFDHAQLSYLPGARQAAKDGHLPGGLKNNREFIGDCAGFATAVSKEYRDLLFDPQTSGGLLITLPEADTAGLERAYEFAYRIGRVLPRDQKAIHLI